MGRRGPAPKPPELRILEGNPGKRAIPEVPKPRPIAPECPDWLADEAKAEWIRVAPELERLGLLTIIDGAALAAYCQAYARWVQAEKALAKFTDLIHEKPSGLVAARPEITIARQAMAQVRAFAAEFGLTPSARGRMTLPEVPSGEDDSPFDV